MAFREGHDVVRPARPDTIAKSLAIGNPADGPYALDVVRRTGGAIEDVTDDEIVEGIRLLAETEGIFAETAGGVTVATLRKLLASGALDPAAETVLLNTGDGLKTLDAVAGHGRPHRHHRPDVDEVTAVLAAHAASPDRERRHGDERVRPHPDDPAHLHRRCERGRDRARRAHARGRRSTRSRPPRPASAPACSTTTAQLRRFVNVYVDDEDVRFTDGLATPVADRRPHLGHPGGRRRLSGARFSRMVGVTGRPLTARGGST